VFLVTTLPLLFIVLGSLLEDGLLPVITSSLPITTVLLTHSCTLVNAPLQFAGQHGLFIGLPLHRMLLPNFYAPLLNNAMPLPATFDTAFAALERTFTAPPLHYLCVRCRTNAARI